MPCNKASFYKVVRQFGRNANLKILYGRFKSCIHRGNILLYTVLTNVTHLIVSTLSSIAHYNDWLYKTDENGHKYLVAETLILRILCVIMEMCSLSATYFLRRGLRNNSPSMLRTFVALQMTSLFVAKILRYLIVFVFVDYKLYLKEKKDFPVMYLYLFLPVFFLIYIWEWLVVRGIRRDMIIKAKAIDSLTKNLQDETIAENPRVYISSDIISETKGLGEGWSSTVFKGKLKNGDFYHPVAIKKMKLNCTEEYCNILGSEIKIFKYVGKHKHVVEFFGVYLHEMVKGDLALILEFCSNGNLKTFLVKNRHLFVHQNDECTEKKHPLYYTNISEPECSVKELIRFSHEIALGMEYLASRKIVHGDLAARNVLLDENLTAKISDFGLSLHLYRYMTYSKCNDYNDKPLPWRWMSIEALEYFKFSEKSDVWAYAVTIWEIFTLGETPFLDADWNTSLVADLKSGKLKLEKPRWGTVAICQIMEDCMNHDDTKRPNFSDIIVILSNNCS